MDFKRDLITHALTRPAIREGVREKYLIPELRAIVAHWTANKSKGANAQRNRDYFGNGSPGYVKGKLVNQTASAHYCVDDAMAVQCIPDNELAFHVGASRYTEFGDKLRRGYPSPNYVSVGFEMCVNKDGDWSKTYKHSATLAAWLLFRHGFNTDRLVRHHDITGKDCPKMFLETEKWLEFKSDVSSEFDAMVNTKKRMMVTSKGLNVRSGPGVSNPVLYELKQDEIVAVPKDAKGWVPVWHGQFVNSAFLADI